MTKKLWVALLVVLTGSVFSGDVFAGMSVYEEANNRIKFEGTITIEEIYQQIANPLYVKKEGSNKYTIYKDFFSDKSSELLLNNCEIVFAGDRQVLTSGKVAISSATIYSVNGQSMITSKRSIIADKLRWWETRFNLSNLYYVGIGGEYPLLKITNSSMEQFTFPVSSTTLTPYWPNYVMIVRAELDCNVEIKNVSFQNVYWNLPAGRWSNYNAVIGLTGNHSVYIDSVTFQNINYSLNDNSGNALIGNWSNVALTAKNIVGADLNLVYGVSEHATVSDDTSYSSMTFTGREIPPNGLLSVGFNRYGHRGSSTGKYIEYLDNIVFKNYDKGIQAITANGFEITDFLISHCHTGSSMGLVWILNASEISLGDAIEPRILKHGTIEDVALGYNLWGTCTKASNDEAPVPPAWGYVKSYSEDVKITASDTAIASRWPAGHTFCGLNDTYNGGNYDLYIDPRDFFINLINCKFDPAKAVVPGSNAWNSFIKDFRLITVQVLDQNNLPVKEAVITITPQNNGEVVQAEALSQNIFLTDVDGYTAIAAVDKKNSPALLHWKRTMSATTSNYSYLLNVTKSGRTVETVVAPGEIFDYRSYGNTVTVQMDLDGADIVPPSAVNTLFANGVGYHSIVLDWTAPGDDGTAGTASQYDIRYGSVPITVDNWAVANQLNGEPVPDAGGRAQNYTVTGLSVDTEYYFALRTADEVLNWSEISNSAQGKTLKVTGVVGEWHFDEGVSTAAFDSSGNDLHGLLNNMDTNICWVAGKRGKALQFDGIDDFVELEDSRFLDFGGGDDFSILAWIKTDLSGGMGIYATKVEWDSGKVLDLRYEGGYNHFMFLYNYGGKSANSPIYSPSIIITKNEWHQLVFVKSGNSGCFYYDGQLKSETKTDLLAAMNKTGGIKRIGKASSLGTYFKGAIDEFKIYDRVLTAEEILQDYNQEPEVVADTVAPQIVIENPQDNAAVVGSVPIIVKVSDEGGVNRVEFYLDDLLMNTNTAASCSWLWETKDYPLGEHRIKVVAYDNSANQGVKEIVVKVVKSNELVVQPNPYVKGKSGTKIFFANLPKQCQVRIYTVSGELIKELKNESVMDGESIDWEVGEVGSGVYLYVVTSSAGVKKGKISIIK